MFQSIIHLLYKAWSKLHEESGLRIRSTKKAHDTNLNFETFVKFYNENRFAIPSLSFPVH